MSEPTLNPFEVLAAMLVSVAVPVGNRGGAECRSSDRERRRLTAGYLAVFFLPTQSAWLLRPASLNPALPRP